MQSPPQVEHDENADMDLGEENRPAVTPAVTAPAGVSATSTSPSGTTRQPSPPHMDQDGDVAMADNEEVVVPPPGEGDVEKPVNDKIIPLAAADKEDAMQVDPPSTTDTPAHGTQTPPQPEATRFVTSWLDSGLLINRTRKSTRGKALQKESVEQPETR